MTDKTKVPALELKGSAYARGIWHSKQPKAPNAEVYTTWKDSIEKTQAKMLNK